MIVITKHDINNLIRDYLHQNGYHHTLFSFTSEALLDDKEIEYSLEDLLQKGAKYAYIEAHTLDDEFLSCGKKFLIAERHVCGDAFDKKNNSKNNNIKLNVEEKGYEKSLDKKQSVESSKHDVNNNFEEVKAEVGNNIEDKSMIENALYQTIEEEQAINIENTISKTHTAADLQIRDFPIIFTPSKRKSSPQTKRKKSSNSQRRASDEVKSLSYTTPRKEYKIKSDIRSSFEKDSSLFSTPTSNSVLKYIPTQLKEHTGDVTVCAWTGNILATGSDDASLRIYKEGRLSDVQTLNSEITAIAWKGNNLSVGTYQGEVYRFAESGGFGNERVDKSHIGPVFSLQYNNNKLLSTGFDGTTNLYNDEIVSLKVHSKSIFDCEWLNEDLYLTCSADFNIGLVNSATQQVEILQGHIDEVNCISYKNNIAASCSDDQTVILWNIENRKNLVLNGHKKNVCSNVWMRDDLCSVGADGRIMIWDVQRGGAKYFYEQEKAVYAIEYSTKNNILVSGGYDRHVVFWDERRGEVKRFKGKGSVAQMKLSEDERFLCICMYDTSPVVLDLRYF